MEITARLTGDAKVITLKNEKQVVNFNVAINDSYKAKGSSEVKKVTTYIQCSYWINPGIAQYLTKGKLVQLYGQIGANAYNNMQGEPKASLTFYVKSIKLHGGSKSEIAKTTAFTASNELTESSDDLPF